MMNKYQSSERVIEAPQKRSCVTTIRRVIDIFSSGNQQLAPKARIAIARYESAKPTRTAVRSRCRDLLHEMLLRTSTFRRSNWELRHAASGAPYLVRDGELSDLNVSVSHTENWIGVGLSSGACIGVDVETIRPRRRMAAISDFLDWKDKTSNLGEFLARWTLWEASAKCMGGSVLQQVNLEFERLSESDSRGQMINATCLAGLWDCLDAEIYYAVVLNGQHTRDMTHRELDVKSIQSW